MDNMNENLKRFTDEVLQSAEKEKAAILAELEEKRKKQFSEIEDKILSDAYISIRQEIDSVKAEFRAKISSAELEAKKDIIKKRMQLEESIFGAAREKILHFTAGEDYKPLLFRLIAQAVTELSGGKFEIFLRAADMKFDAELKKIYPDCIVTQTSKISLGGFIIFSQEDHFNIDRSFDELFEKQREKFRYTSGLYVD